MDENDLQDYFLRLLELLRAERIEPLLAMFDYPVVAYRDDRPMVVQNPAQMERALRSYRGHRPGIIGLHLRPELTFEQPHGINSRTPILVNWIFSDAEGREVARSEVRYYANLTSGRPRIEMIEFLSIAALPHLVMADEDETFTRH